jgi:hypothetical protein
MNRLIHRDSCESGQDRSALHRAEFAGAARLNAPRPKVDADRVLVIRAWLATLILIALFFRRGCDPRLLAPRRSRARCFSRQRHHAQFRRAHRPHMLRYGARSALCRQELFAKGQALEHQTEEKLRDSKGYEHLHHILTVAVTLLHVAIAIATIAIIVRGRRVT